MGSVPKRIQVNTYLTLEQHAQAHYVGMRTGRPIYQVISDALVIELNKYITPAERKASRDQAIVREKVSEKKRITRLAEARAHRKEMKDATKTTRSRPAKRKSAAGKR